MIERRLQEALKTGDTITVLCLVQDPDLQKLTRSLGIENFFFIKDPQKVFSETTHEQSLENVYKVPTYWPTTGITNSQKRPTSPTALSAEKLLPILADSRIFIFDGLTFTGNRVRATLLWVMENIGTCNPVSVINMISSRRSHALLAHSFSYAEFHTLSELVELDGIWDMPKEGKFLRNLLGQETLI